MARLRALVAACLAFACVPAGCDLYDDVALYDAPWAYWRLVPPSLANESDVIADSSGRCASEAQRAGPTDFTVLSQICRADPTHFTCTRCGTVDAPDMPRPPIFSRSSSPNMPAGRFPG
jgi:hypothetical protein